MSDCCRRFLVECPFCGEPMLVKPDVGHYCPECGYIRRLPQESYRAEWNTEVKKTGEKP